MIPENINPTPEKNWSMPVAVTTEIFFRRFECPLIWSQEYKGKMTIKNIPAQICSKDAAVDSSAHGKISG